MSLLQKSVGSPFICKIYLDFTGNLLPILNNGSLGFGDSTASNNTWNKIQFTKSRVSFNETSKTTDAGTEYSQSLSIRFKNNFELKSAEIALIEKTRFIQLEMSDGKKLVLGRNDFFQNRLPEKNISSDTESTTITFKTKSIFSFGYAEVNEFSDFLEFLLPNIVPINLQPL